MNLKCSLDSDVERRIAPRFAISFPASLDVGKTLLPVTVRDMSMTGCGIEVAEHAARELFSFDKAALHVPSRDQESLEINLSVSFRHRSQNNNRFQMGLRYEGLILQQVRNLIMIIDAGMIR